MNKLAKLLGVMMLAISLLVCGCGGNDKNDDTTAASLDKIPSKSLGIDDEEFNMLFLSVLGKYQAEPFYLGENPVVTNGSLLNAQLDLNLANAIKALKKPIVPEVKSSDTGTIKTYAIYGAANGDAMMPTVDLKKYFNKDNEMTKISVVITKSKDAKEMLSPDVIGTQMLLMFQNIFNPELTEEQFAEVIQKIMPYEAKKKGGKGKESVDGYEYVYLHIINDKEDMSVFTIQRNDKAITNNRMTFDLNKFNAAVQASAKQAKEKAEQERIASQLGQFICSDQNCDYYLEPDTVRTGDQKYSAIINVVAKNDNSVTRMMYKIRLAKGNRYEVNKSIRPDHGAIQNIGTVPVTPGTANEQILHVLQSFGNSRGTAP